MARKLTFWLIGAALPGVPLVFFPDTNLIFEIPKVAVFRILVLLVWVGLAWQIFTGAREGRIEFWHEKWVGRFVLGWVGVLALATVFSVAPWTSFWGSYFRQQGFLQMIFYLMFFGAIVCTGASAPIKVKQIVAWLCLGSFVAAAAAIAHYFAWDVYRAFGTMGHPNFLGAYLVMCLPFCVWLFKDGTGRSEEHTSELQSR